MVPERELGERVSRGYNDAMNPLPPMALARGSVAPGLAGLLLAAFLLDAQTALACGASPGGPMGHTMCGLDDAPLEHRVRAGTSYAFSDTRLSFDGARFDMQRHLTVATLDYRVDKRNALTAGAGGFIEGALVGPFASNMGGGPAAMAGYSSSLVKERERVPFLVLTMAMSFLHSNTRPTELRAERAGFTALDFRGGLLLGKTFFEHLTIYAAGRLFGGPAFWRIDGQGAVGTDIYHYQLGGGLIARIPGGLDVFAEGIGLGERGLVAGLGITP